MAVFGALHFDNVIQVGEKVRLDGSKSFLTPNELPVTLVRIEPDSGAGFISVATNGSADTWYLDWIYDTAGSKTASIEITNGGPPSLAVFTVNVVTEVSENLFSNDQQLIKYEPDLMKWLPPGRSTWNFVHRQVQTLILTEIYKSRIFALDGTKLTPAEVVDIHEVREWATYYALSIIFKGLQNAVNDVFSEKSKEYQKKAQEFMNYSFNILKLDYNKDGSLTDSERYDLRSGGLIRR